MSYTFHELKEKTIADLRSIAVGIEHEAVKGYTQLNKEHLLVALCKALNIDMHEHHRAVAADKTLVKSKIHLLKKSKDEAIAAKDKVKVKRLRQRIRSLKNKLRRSMV
jgi:hypothetical protein